LDGIRVLDHEPMVHSTRGAGTDAAHTKGAQRGVNDVVSLVAEGPGRTSRLARIAPDAGFRVDQMLPERQLPLGVCLPHHCARNRPRKKTFEGSARARSRPDAPLRSALGHRAKTWLIFSLPLQQSQR
jgi:hypothetical protein